MKRRLQTFLYKEIDKKSSEVEEISKKKVTQM